MPVYFWRVEFEIPPLRALYEGYYDADSEEELRRIFAIREPRGVIRTITKMPPADGGREITEDRKDEP